MTDRPTAAQRLRGIDAARGAAMFFVCLSHFALCFFAVGEAESTRFVLWLVGMVASPTFMIISGTVTGLAHQTRPDSFARFARLLAGRGIFLLTVGHVLILLAIIPQTNNLERALGRGFITDAIGVCILIGPWLVLRTSVATRLAFATVLLALTWILALLWTPGTAPASVVRYLLVGPWSREMTHNFPLLPWVAVYLGGTAVGSMLGRLAAQQRTAAFAVVLARCGVVAVVLGVGLKLGYWAARDIGWVQARVDGWYLLTQPIQKIPPAPAYIAFYGGVGLLITAFLLAAEKRHRLVYLTEQLSVLGRNSLFVFLLQFYVYYVIIFLLPHPFAFLWPLYFALTIAGITLLTRTWERTGYNQYFDALSWFSRPAPAPAPSVPLLAKRQPR
jgi:uncharacterized membrane protein